MGEGGRGGLVWWDCGGGMFREGEGAKSGLCIDTAGTVDSNPVVGDGEEPGDLFR